MALTRLKPQLLVGGAFGEVSRDPIVFDVVGGDGYELARKTGGAPGTYRLGARSIGDITPDTRPVILQPNTALSVTGNTTGAYTQTRGASSVAISQSQGSFGGGESVSQTDGTFPSLYEFRNDAFTLAVNEAFGVRAFVSDISKDESDSQSSDKGHVAYFRLGVPGRGFKVQVRDGNIEALHLKTTWNQNDELDLHDLWQLQEPTDAETLQMQALERKLYDVSQGLSFEGGLGRDEWRGDGWFLLLLPEFRGAGELGAVHFLLEGGAVATLDLAQGGDYLDSDGIGHPPVGDLWDLSQLYFGATGGAFHWQLYNVRFDAEGSLTWGWFRSGTDTTQWSDFESNVFYTGGAASPASDFQLDVATEVVNDDRNDENGDALPSLRFQIKTTLTTSDRRYTPILHSQNSGFNAGERSGGSADTLIDTLDLGTGKDEQPITELRFRLDESGRRTVDGVLREIEGKAMGGHSIADLAGHVATVKLEMEPFITGGIITRARANDLKRVASIPESGTPLWGGQWTSNRQTTWEWTLDQGNWLDSDVLINPPLVLDGLFLGEAIRRCKRRAGWMDAELAGIPSQIGPRLPSPRPGEGRCIVMDEGTSVESAVSGLLDRFGYGLRYGRTRAGVWYLETIPQTIRWNYTSDGSQNDPNLIRGGTREMELRPLVWEIDNENYYTIFTVEGGPKGRKIRRQFINHAAVKLGPGNIPGPYYRGHHRAYPILRDEGLRTVSDVVFALRSLVWRNGRPGKVASHPTWLNMTWAAWDRGYSDGILTEMISWEGGTRGGEIEQMSMRVRQVVPMFI